MTEPTDDPQDSPMKALDEAIGKCPSLTSFAERIGARAQSTVSMWKARRRIPAEYCPAIERETGVRCERLRPDIPWDVLRERAGDCSGHEPWDGVERRHPT